MTSDEYERRAQELVGHTLAEVLYFEIDDRNEAGESVNKPSWNRDWRFDSLDFGLELQTREGDGFWISWGHEFFQYDIEVERNSKNDRSGMRRWNVSRTSRWRRSIGKKIVAVATYWSWVDEPAEEGWRRIQYPQDLRITFESGETVYLSALEVRQDGAPIGFTDNITVFFDEAIARKYGVGPYASARSGRS